MRKIAFDLMANDNGVKAGVDAVKEFIKNNKDYKFFLVGNKDEISQFISESEQVEFVHTDSVVNSEEGARAARKGDSSMAIAINLVKENKADAVLSSGDSGIYLSMATLTLRRFEGVKRPAFMPVFPTIIKGQRFVMMDVGANLETTGEMLVQWAELGNAFSKNVLKIAKPRVGVVNIGTEETKGKEFHAEAFGLLKENKNINFIGFVEPRELLNGTVDVAVVDGYAGNMILKSMEGTVLSLLSLMKSALTSKTKYKIGALISKGAFDIIKETLDYRNVGSAWIIGVDGLAIKCHGGADTKSYLGAFNQINEALKGDALVELKKAVVHE